MGKILQLKLKLFFLPCVFSLQDFIHADVFFKCVYIYIFISIYIYLFIYFWLHWVFIAALRLSLAVVSKRLLSSWTGLND